MSSSRLCLAQQHWMIRFSLPLLAGLSMVGCGGDGDGMVGPEPGTLSGTITIASGSRVDADTALDLETSGLDSSRTQPLAGVQNPDNAFPGNVLAGGFVSFDSGSYSAEFAFPRDRSDVLRINLVEGQRVSVNVFPAPFNVSGESGFDDPETRLTLEPVNDASGAVSTASNTELNKSVKAQQDGEHDLTIEATGGGPARYVLRATSLSQDETLGQASMDFKPGEAIITMESRISSGGIRAQAVPSVNAANQRSLGGNQFRAEMPLKRQAVLPATAAPASRKQETLEWIRELNNTPGVASAVPNHHVRAALLDPGPTTQSQYDSQKWHYQLINAETAWSDVKNGGSSVRVAVLDTGIARIDNDWHPDLAPNIDCNDTSRCYDAVDGDHFPENESGGNHGTHVTGIAAADASQQGDVTGVAHGADLVPVRVLGTRDGTVADVIEGIRWVTNNGDPRADIINLSLGSQTDNPALRDAVTEAAAAGVLVVAASGNAGDDRPFYPAAYAPVLAVGAVDCQGNRSSFSNFGNWLDLAAPGGGNPDQCSDNSNDFVFSSVSSGTPPVGGLQGTSMASPHVAGVLGLMREKTPDLETPVIRALLREGRITQTSTNGSFDQEVGRGIIDAGAAVSVDAGGFAALAPDPERFRLDDDLDQVDLSLNAVGDENASFSNAAVTEDEDWLQVESVSGERNYRVSLNRNAMEEGIFYRGSLAVSYEVDGQDGNRTYQVPVTATLEAGESERNAGAHFVQLIPADASNDGTVSENTVQTLVEARDGQYRFQFDTKEMEPGKYLLIAGSDLDNDGAFCGPGEACAEFPVTGQPQPIEITRDMSRTVELETAFTRPVDSQRGEIMPIGGYRRLNQKQGK